MTLLSQKPSSNGCKDVDLQSWQSKKILELLGSRLRFLRVYIVKSLLSEQPGFESRAAQTLGIYNFEASWSTRSYITFFEISSPYLIAEEVKMSLTAFLMHSFLGQKYP